jgi:hypothetical protein
MKPLIQRRVGCRAERVGDRPGTDRAAADRGRPHAGHPLGQPGRTR